MLENWNFSKLCVLHMFYDQIRGAENDSWIIFLVWPNSGSTIRKKVYNFFQNLKFRNDWVFCLKQRIWSFTFAPLEAMLYLALPRTTFTPLISFLADFWRVNCCVCRYNLPMQGAGLLTLHVCGSWFNDLKPTFVLFQRFLGACCLVMCDLMCCFYSTFFNFVRQRCADMELCKWF